jgi:hypothetical protein
MKLLRLTSVVILFLLLQGCMLSGKMTRIVSEYYAPKAKLRVEETPAWLTVKTDNLERINGYCQANYKRFFTVPLIVYVYSDEKIQCAINPKIYVNTFTSALQKQGLDNKLNGKILEISFDHIPTTFNHRYYSHFVAVQLFIQNMYFSVTENELSNKAGEIRATYKLIDPGTLSVIKTGTLTAGIPANFYVKNYSERRLYFVRDYISSFDAQLEGAINQLTANLIYQLQL